MVLCVHVLLHYSPPPFKQPQQYTHTKTDVDQQSMSMGDIINGNLKHKMHVNPGPLNRPDCSGNGPAPEHRREGNVAGMVVLVGRITFFDHAFSMEMSEHPDLTPPPLPLPWRSQSTLRPTADLQYSHNTYQDKAPGEESVGYGDDDAVPSADSEADDTRREGSLSMASAP